MSWMGRWSRRLRRLRGRRELEGEMDEEMRLHLELEVEELERRGLRPGEARRQALLAFGGVERFKEEGRDARGTRWLEDLARDLRYSGRALARNRGYAASVVLTLGLGIGATAAIIALVNAVLLRPLPYPDSGRLVALQHAARGLGVARGGISEGLYL